MSGRKNFVAGEILTAADVNSFLMDQSVMVFDDSAARESAIPTPSEGMVTYRKDDNAVEVFDGSSFGPIGKILQVVTAQKTNTFSTTSTSYVDVPGLRVTITPVSASNNILILGNLTIGHGAAGAIHFRVNGGNASSFVGDAAGSRIRAIGGGTFSTNDGNPRAKAYSQAISFVDAPNTTSAVTYDVQIIRGGTSGTVHVNRTDNDPDSTFYPRGASSITVLEVAG